MNNIFVECDCHCEALQIEKQDDGEVWLSFWKQGFDASKEMSFREKLHLIWYIIRNGRPYSDMLIFDKDKIEKIAKYLKD